MANVEELLSRLDRSEVIYKPKKKPHFSSELEEKKWYAKIIELCYTGDKNQYGLFIPGSLVFMAHFASIQDRILGSTESLIIRDVDYILHTNMYNSMQEGKWDLYLKARGVGFSTVFGGIIPMYFAFMNAGCSINITHADQSRLFELYNRITTPMWEGLDPKIRPDALKETNSKSGVGLILAVNTVENGVPKIKPTRITFKPTHHSKIAASGFSGGGNRFAFIDEYFLNKQAEAVASSLVAASTDKKSMKLLGYVAAGGTCENTVSGDQLKEFKKGWMRADDSHIWNKTFLPYWLGFGVHLNNGHSDVEGAKIIHEKELELYTRGGNQEKLIAFLKDNPETEKDVFDLASTGRFEPKIHQLIQEQYDKVLKMKDNIWSPSFIKIINGKTEAIPTKKSPMRILEQPKPNVSYWVLVDNIGKGKDVGAEDGSKYSAMVVKGVDPSDKNWKPVAHYLERPDRLEQAYDQTLDLALHYNTFGNLQGIAIEANSNVEFFGVWLSGKGYFHFILNARDLSGKGNINTNKIGQDRTTQTEIFQYRFMNVHLAKYVDSITLVPLLEDMLTDADTNADTLDSFLQLSTALPPNYDKVAEKKKQVRKMIWYNENGKTGFKLVTDGEHGISQIRPRENPHLYNATPK